MTFIDELLKEAEQREAVDRIEMSKLRADQVLMALSVLEGQADAVNQLVDEELKILEDYKTAELSKLQKKMSWLEYQLEQYMRSTGEKTINLAHGSIKLRLGREKVSVVDLERFMPVAMRNDLLKQIPASSEPDIDRIKSYIKINRTIPAGVTLQPAQTRFSYTTLKGKTNGERQEESAEIGIAAK